MSACSDVMIRLFPLLLFLAAGAGSGQGGEGAGADAHPGADWPQFRGPGRDGVSPEVPAEMPPKKLLWRRPMMGKCYGGVAVGGGYLVVPDYGNGKDFLRCYTAEKARTAWVHSYDNGGEMEYTPGPRATPLIHGGMVYTLGSTGDLYCLNVENGEVIWHVNFARDFGAKVPQYGYSSSPVIADGKLVVNPGGPDASVVALDPETGKVIWKTPGASAAYASLIVGTFGGVRQVVGYDVESLGGWDLATGKRLWKLVPEVAGDFNVGTPVDLGGKILVCTENNYARLYGFAEGGKIAEEPLARNDDLALDMATPVAINGLAFGTTGGLVCLDVNGGLQTRWISDKHDPLWGFSNIIAGDGRIMVFCEDGTAFLVAAEGNEPRILGSMPLCKQTWSHPAISRGRLYIRDDRYLYCYSLK